MLPFTADVFDSWQSDYEDFNYAFRNFCFQQFRVFGVKADFVPNVTTQIHEQWVKDCDHWLDVEAHPDTKKLSYLKRASLLLYNLTSEQFIGNVYPHDYQEEAKYIFRGTPEHLATAKRDFLDAREVVLALDFVLNIIVYFEKNRSDRTDEFRHRMTRDMRHDLIGYLLTHTVDKKALYLILKALFLRPSKGGAAN